MNEIMMAAVEMANAVPEPDNEGVGDIEGFSDGFSSLLGLVRWVSLGVVVAGLIIAGATMAIQARRGEGGEHMGKLGMALGGVIVIAAATSLVGFLVG